MQVQVLTGGPVYEAREALWLLSHPEIAVEQLVASMQNDPAALRAEAIMRGTIRAGAVLVVERTAGLVLMAVADEMHDIVTHPCERSLRPYCYTHNSILSWLEDQPFEQRAYALSGLVDDFQKWQEAQRAELASGAELFSGP
jgi:hypothetical protein